MYQEIYEKVEIEDSIKKNIETVLPNLRPLRSQSHHIKQKFRLNNSETKENNLKLTQKQHEQIKTKPAKMMKISLSFPSPHRSNSSLFHHHHHQYRRLSFSFTGDGCVVCFNCFFFVNFNLSPLCIEKYFLRCFLSVLGFFLSFCCFLLLVMCVCCCFVGFPLNLYCFSFSL